MYKEYIVRIIKEAKLAGLSVKVKTKDGAKVKYYPDRHYQITLHCGSGGEYFYRNLEEFIKHVII